MSRPWLSLAVLAVVVLGAAAACSGSSRPAQQGPNYSKTPCFDNCGANVQCQLACQGLDHGVPPPHP